MNIEYKNAGTGAISYAKEFIDVKDDRNKAMEVISDLLAGKLHDPSDKRIKRCAYCNYYYRDKTRPNNSKTCSKDCKTKLDTERRASKRRKDKKEQATLKSGTIKERTYHGHLEYPFWNGDIFGEKEHTDEQAMQITLSNYEQPYDNINEIASARQRYEMWGGRRRHSFDQSKDYYNGNWNEGFR